MLHIAKHDNFLVVTFLLRVEAQEARLILAVLVARQWINQIIDLPIVAIAYLCQRLQLREVNVERSRICEVDLGEVAVEKSTSSSSLERRDAGPSTGGSCWAS